MATSDSKRAAAPTRGDKHFLDELRQRLYSAVLSDVLDELGITDQAMAVRIECAGVRIESGDLIFGDVDGVVVVPRRVEDEVLARALEKVSSENVTRDELLRGAKLKDVYDRYGVL